VKASDFQTIKHFTAKEALKTGAKLKDIKYELFYTIDLFRSLHGRVVKIPKNGISSGSHSPKSRHYRTKTRLADGIDVYFREKDGPVDYRKVIVDALIVGFKGIGVYWNGKAYSFHFDLRPKLAFWRARKDEPGDKWTYKPLLIDPKTKGA